MATDTKMSSGVGIVTLHHYSDSGTLIADVKVKTLSLLPQGQSPLPRIIIFTGFGEQRDESLRAAAEPFAQAGFPVTSIAVPFDRHGLATWNWLLDAGLKQVVAKVISKNQVVILSGVSRGANIAASIVEQLPQCQGLVMLSPLGLAPLHGNKYIARSIKEYFTNRGYLDKETRRNAYDILKEVHHHIRSEDGLRVALNFAMSQQRRAMKGIKHIDSKKDLLAVFVGEKDSIFTAQECRKALADVVNSQHMRDTLQTIPGDHAPVASRMGQTQLKLVAEWLSNRAS